MSTPDATLLAEVLRHALDGVAVVENGGGAPRVVYANATLAALLGRHGLRVCVFDKAAGIYDQPRAVGFDHDAMRLFQRIGVAESLWAGVEELDELARMVA
jgi:hypothetical protein